MDRRAETERRLERDYASGSMPPSMRDSYEHWFHPPPQPIDTEKPVSAEEEREANDLLEQIRASMKETDGEFQGM